MVFSDTSTKQGLIQDCEMLVFNEYGTITGKTNLLHNFTNLLNRQYDKALSIIFEADGRWQADDTSYTTTMVNTTTLTSGQYAYTLDAEHIKVLGLRVKDASGKWHDLKSIDRTDQDYPQFGIDSGLPQEYDKQGDQLLLNPMPNYTQAASLEITVQRIPNYFAYTDTTKSAGISQVFHRFLSLGASLDYAIVNRLDSKNDIAELFRDERERMEKHYSRRNRDERDRMRPAQHSTR